MEMSGKVLLISLQHNTDVIGLKYIHSYLINKEINSSILFVPRYNPENYSAIEEFVRALNPDIIGISLMSSEFDDAKQISIEIKRDFPEIILAWGGIHPTIDPEGCLHYADYVFLGESEEAFYEFVSTLFDKKPVTGIKNVGYKISGTVHLNEIRPFNEDLDLLPFPEHLPKSSYILHQGRVTGFNRDHLRRYNRYSGRFLSIISSRGCPFSCTYCCNSVFSRLYGKNAIRKRSVDNIIAELTGNIKEFPEIYYINIQDDNFLSYDVQWLKEFSGKYQKEIKKGFICRTTPAHLNEEKLIILKEAGLSIIIMGLQSGSRRITTEVYKRYISSEKFIEATKLINKYKITGFYDIILDNPYESEDEIIQTIDVILQIPKPYALQLFSLCFYQGTELYERALKEGISFEDSQTKNYGKHRPTFLNNVIRICPLVPGAVITHLVKHRNSRYMNLVLKVISFFAIVFIEPVVRLRLTIFSMSMNSSGTLSMVMTFIKMGFGRMIALLKNDNEFIQND